MERADLIAKIAKKEKDIEKINKRIAKWGKGLRPEDIAACVDFGNCIYGSAPRGASWNQYHGTPEYQAARAKYSDYIKSHNDIPSADDWNKGPNIDELHRAYIDLGEANNTLNKYKAMLAEMDAFDQQEKNPAIWEFLTTWAQMCKEWYKKNAEKYYQLSLTYEEDLARAEATWKEQHPNEKSWTAYIWKEKYEATYFRTINALTKSLTKIVRNYREEGYPITGYELDEAKLDRVLEEEKNRKYKELLDRVTEVVGTITDASNLTIGNQNGEINGFVIGHEGKCSVETISAGGYNIQCFHYRVLVKPIR